MKKKIISIGFPFPDLFNFTLMIIITLFVHFILFIIRTYIEIFQKQFSSSLPIFFVFTSFLSFDKIYQMNKQTKQTKQNKTKQNKTKIFLFTFDYGIFWCIFFVSPSSSDHHHHHHIVGHRKPIMFSFFVSGEKKNISFR